MSIDARTHAESSILGGLFLLAEEGNEETILETLSIVNRNHFLNGSRIIFDAFLQMRKDSLPIDIITVSHYLENCGQLETIGGGKAIGQLYADATGTSNIISYANLIVKDVPKTWEHLLKRDRFENVTNSKNNIKHILTNHPAWIDVIGFNEFNRHISKRKTPPYPDSPNQGLGEWTDIDNEMLSMWLGENYDFEPSTDKLQSLVVAISMSNRYHPVRDYLESCHRKWLKAGSPRGRATTWCEVYLGAKESPATRLFEKTWLISAVARIFEPGVKADNVLILEGKQGYLKSTALSVLGGEWFSDSTIDFADKDSLMLIHENWIIEMPELDKFKKADSDRAKNFFAKGEDKYRAPYGHNVITMYRQCVFAGTTNTSDYLKDSTGNRRYMPIECLTKCDIDTLRKDRDMIWGEAVALYKEGEKWFYDDTLSYVVEAQNARFAEDVWQDAIDDYLTLKDECTIQTILTDGLKMDLDRCDKMARNRVADVLRALSWKQSDNIVINGKRKKGWKRP